MVSLYERTNTAKRQKDELERIPRRFRQPHIDKPLFGHQLITLDLYRNSPQVLDFSDPGTGKTRSALQAFAERRRAGGGKALVLAPKTLLETAWGNEAREFTPDMVVSVGYASNREKAFEADADIYITNLDGIKWLLQHYALLDGFDTIIIDEITAFKHGTSNRSKAARTLCKHFTYRAGLTGTPNSRSVTDIWHQAFIVDSGERLGKNFTGFKYAVQEQHGPYEWVDRAGSEEAVAGMLSDISVRHRFEDCMDIPPNVINFIKYHPPSKVMKAYEELELRTEMDHESGNVTAANAAVLRNKLLQVASGAVYSTADENNKREVVILDYERAELVMDLVEEIDEPCLVFFNWGHQKDQLLALAKKRKINHELLDRTTSDSRRAEIVRNYQAGLHKLLLLHPKTGAHGLTLTRGRRTICISPFDEADFVKQIIHRTYRGGQKHRTETIMIQAEGTIEGSVYAKRDGKYNRMRKFLELCELDDQAPDIDQ